VLLEQAAEWSINVLRELLHHTSCQLGSAGRVGLVTQLPICLVDPQPPVVWVRRLNGLGALRFSGLTQSAANPRCPNQILPEFSREPAPQFRVHPTPVRIVRLLKSLRSKFTVVTVIRNPCFV
jgi:hypothetical protein